MHTLRNKKNEIHNLRTGTFFLSFWIHVERLKLTRREFGTSLVLPMSKEIVWRDGEYSASEKISMICTGRRNVGNREQRLLLRELLIILTILQIGTRQRFLTSSVVKMSTHGADRDDGSAMRGLSETSKDSKTWKSILGLSLRANNRNEGSSRKVELEDCGKSWGKIGMEERCSSRM